MSKKILPFLVCFIFISSSNVVWADVVINEIMYAPANGSNYEWVEIFNSGQNSVDLSGWRFFHGENTSGPLTLRNGTTNILEPSKYAIITKSPSVVVNYDWLNFSGMILSASTLSLPDGADNTYIAIASDANKTISNLVTYDTGLGGNKESGNSLSKMSSGWLGATPTPGEANETIVPPASPLPISNSASSETIVQEENNVSKKIIIEEPKIKTQIIVPKIIFVGSPAVIEVKAFGYEKEQLRYGKYFLNFGDGDFKEIKMPDNQKITHTYMYAGDYIINLEYYMNVYGDVPDASDQITIKVVSTDIVISKVGDEQDFFVELSNNTNYDEDISGWSLAGVQKSFVIPKNTIIGSKKKIIFSPKITNLSILDKETLKLMTKQGFLVFDYGATLVKEISPRIFNSPHPNPLPIKEREEEKIPEENLVNEIAPTPELSALAINTENIVQKDNLYLSIFASMIFIISSAGAVYFIRRKKVIQKVGDDFAILDD